ncbi:uncharacterized protein EI90DRAFT_3157676, partial [Cantharellus anzutake]|uniref:uncharacterized protein n=1 Tax=Cantharellus anzutake TaxID=1750568 RepID=UPI001908A47C
MAFLQFENSVEDCLKRMASESTFDHWQRIHAMTRRLADVKQTAQQLRMKTEKELGERFTQLEKLKASYKLPLGVSYCQSEAQFEQEYQRLFGNESEISMDLEWTQEEGPVGWQASVFQWIWEFFGLMPPRIRTIQIAQSSGVIVYQICTRTCPRKVKEILLAEDIMKFGVGIQSDINMVREVWGLGVSNAMGIGSITLEEHPKRWQQTKALNQQPGMQKLAVVYLDRRIEKHSNNFHSGWSAPVLSEKQLEYAAIDAYASYQILERIRVEEDGEAIL